MLTVHQKLSEELQASVLEYLETTVTPKLYVHQGGVADGRHELWIPYRAPLYDAQGWAPGLLDARMWSWISTQVFKSTGFKAEVGLMSRGGVIGKHRDAGYAGFTSVGINLGVATFHYTPQYPLGQWVKDAPQQPTQTLHLTGGEVFSFNPKNEHWVTDVAPNRWGINVWDVRPKQKAAYNKMLSQYPL